MFYNYIRDIFLLVPGLKVIYDVKENNQWDRVLSLRTLCDGVDPKPVGQASPEELCELEMDREYKVSVVSFLADGGSRHVRFDGEWARRLNNSLIKINAHLRDSQDEGLQPSIFSFIRNLSLLFNDEL